MVIVVVSCNVQRFKDRMKGDGYVAEVERMSRGRRVGVIQDGQKSDC